MKTGPFRWVDPKPVDVDPGLASLAVHPVVAQALVRRGFTSRDTARGFLDPAFYTPSQPGELPDLPVAVDLLLAAIRGSRCIGVWGDFDVDGQTATAILVSALRKVGANVVYHIPVRGLETHGIGVPALQAFLDQGVDVLLSCDTGISSHDAVEFAHSRGVQVVVTDHHTLPPDLPPADAVVNPQRLPDGHPMGGLCGAGTAWQVAKAILSSLGKPEAVDETLDLVALGSVADVALLTGDNRWLVQRGLSVLRSSTRPAIAANLALAGVNPAFLSEEHISFILAPRLNAVGRLDDANPVVEFLLAVDLQKVQPFAARLEGLNARRKLLTDQVFQAARAQIAADHTLLEDPVLILHHPRWPAGVVGIVASRLVELYHRPVILFTAPPDQPARGSARSVEGVNITAAIAENADMLLGYGGHPMAAGLSLETARIPDFRRALARTLLRSTPMEEKIYSLPIDAWFTLDEISLDLVEAFDSLAPFGPGNPPLTLAIRNLLVRDALPIGHGREHLQIIVEDETGNSRKVIWWQGAGFPLPEGHFDLACTLRASDYRGSRAPQVEWLNARSIEGGTVELAGKQTPRQVVDLRQDHNPEEHVRNLSDEPGVCIWAEGAHLPGFPTGDRRAIFPCQTLVIWTAPPGRAEFNTALETAQCQMLVLVGVLPGDDEPGQFLTRLAGLVRYSLAQREGHTSLAALASATAQREITILKGLDWLTASGHIGFELGVDGEITLTPGGVVDMQAKPVLEGDIKILLSETAAYRSYFRRVEAGEIQR